MGALVVFLSFGVLEVVLLSGVLKVVLLFGVHAYPENQMYSVDKLKGTNRVSGTTITYKHPTSM